MTESIRDTQKTIDEIKIKHNKASQSSLEIKNTKSDGLEKEEFGDFIIIFCVIFFIFFPFSSLIFPDYYNKFTQFFFLGFLILDIFLTRIIYKKNPINRIWAMCERYEDAIVALFKLSISAFLIWIFISSLYSGEAFSWIIFIVAIIIWLIWLAFKIGKYSLEKFIRWVKSI